jgi:uridylate kinase
MENKLPMVVFNVQHQENIVRAALGEAGVGTLVAS